MFELGLATALNRPLIIVTPAGGMSDYPPEISDLPRISLEVLESEEFADAVETLLRPRERRYPLVSKPRSTRLGSFADKLLQRSESIQREVELHDLLAEALARSGAEVIRESSTVEGRRADLVAWHDDLTSLGANPLIIEVKSFVPDQPDPQLAFSLDALLQAAGTRVALVVYLDGPGWRVDELGDGESRVVFVQWRELIERLRNGPLPSVVSSLLRDPSSI
jgi:hypothetical protein